MPPHPHAALDVDATLDSAVYAYYIRCDPSLKGPCAVPAPSDGPCATAPPHLASELPAARAAQATRGMR